MTTRKLTCIPVFLLLVNCSLHAQSGDTLSAKKITEKGSKGDIILGEKNKKDQLNHVPVLPGSKDSLYRKDVIQPTKKIRRKQK